MFGVGFGMCVLGFVWLFAAFVFGPEPANNFTIIGAAVFVGGLVLVAGAEICGAIRELKNSPDQEEEQPTEGGG